MGYSTAFLATFVAGKRQIDGALPRQTPRSGFLGWPPAALSFVSTFSNFGLSHDKLAKNSARKAAGEKQKSAEGLATDHLEHKLRRFKLPHDALANDNAPSSTH